MKIGEGQGRGVAHVKRPAHVRDAGRVEAERLIKLHRGLPRVASKAQRGELRAKGDRAVHAACRGEGDSRLEGLVGEEHT